MVCCLNLFYYSGFATWKNKKHVFLTMKSNFKQFQVMTFVSPFPTFRFSVLTYIWVQAKCISCPALKAAAVPPPEEVNDEVCPETEYASKDSDTRCDDGKKTF